MSIPLHHHLIFPPIVYDRSHLVLSARRRPANIIFNFPHKSQSSAAPLSSARLIPDNVCISSICIFFFPLRMPTSYPFPYRLLASYVQRTPSCVLLTSVSAATYGDIHL